MPTRQFKNQYIVHQHLQGHCSILTVLRPSIAGTVPIIRNSSKIQILDISDNSFTGTQCHDYLGVSFVFLCSAIHLSHVPFTAFHLECVFCVAGTLPAALPHSLAYFNASINNITGMPTSQLWT